jgi:hypothetical protein
VLRSVGGASDHSEQEDLTDSYVYAPAHGQTIGKLAAHDWVALMSHPGPPFRQFSAELLRDEDERQAVEGPAGEML